MEAKKCKWQNCASHYNQERTYILSYFCTLQYFYTNSVTLMDSWDITQNHISSQTEYIIFDFKESYPSQPVTCTNIHYSQEALKHSAHLPSIWYLIFKDTVNTVPKHLQAASIGTKELVAVPGRWDVGTHGYNTRLLWSHRRQPKT